MGSSTTSLQSLVDYVCSLGEMQPVIPASGFGIATALTMCTDVMADLISQRFNWKWNRFKIPPFYTISWQQDYAQLGSALPYQLGWLEGAYWVDINNTALPKPTYPIEVVRDLPATSISGNPPGKVTWHYNDQLIQGVWPGANQKYTNPLGAPITPTNPITNILDVNGNILVLTTYGTTGATPPSLPANSAEGTTVSDGSCVWSVAGPRSQGFRLLPMPPQQAVCYQVNLIGQRKAPPPFTSMQQTIDPIPDDYANHFRTGFSVYCYKLSPNEKLRGMFPTMQQSWLAAIEASMKQADREIDNAGFIPDRSVVAPQGGVDIGPANPYLYNVWPGR
jgi:hypothetical protein